MAAKKNFKDETFIVMPIYNESSQIQNLVNTLNKFGYKNIVTVDDGSRDNTYEVLKKIKGIYVLQHIKNRGQGAALRTGTDYAVKMGAKYIVHFDSDGQHPADEIDNLVEPLINENKDVVLGSRFIGDKSKGNVPFSKVITLKIGILVTWFISGIMLSDTHNGFRAMTADITKKVAITLDRYEHASEILDLIKQHKLNYKEIPVTIRYTEYSTSAGRGQRFSNSVKILLNMLIYKLNKIIYP